MWFDDIEKPILILAPMADYTDSPFCTVCRNVAGNNFVIFREMVSSEAIIRDSEKTMKMCKFSKKEKPIVIQVFGSDPKNVSKAIGIIRKKNEPDGFDINMGCPVPKITGKNKAGSYLMTDHDLAISIIKQIKRDHPGICLSVKTRLGWNKPDEILEFASKLEKAGIDLITIHGRTKKQGYSGVADWKMIGEVKKILNIPVIANGDVTNKVEKQECLDVTKADGIMIGRGALGNPWIFSEEVDLRKKVVVILDHAKRHLEYYNQGNLVTFRKHLAWYFKGNKIGELKKPLKDLRASLMQVKSIEDLKIHLLSLLV